MQFRIVIISPPGFEHAAAFTEVAETLAHGFRALGHPASIALNAFLPEATNVVLGCHMLPAEAIAQLPPETVVYNLEQVEDSLFEWAPQLKDVFAKFEVWDYSLRNMERLAALRLAPRLHYLPIGTMPELTRITPAQDQDIDVLFYGVVSERRRVILKAIQDGGVKVAAVFGCYGAARDALIARAKLVLTLHKHEAQVFEVVRVSYLLANRKAVVAEINDATAIDPDLAQAVAGGPPDSLPALCRRLVNDPAARRALEQRGYVTMTARQETRFLAALLTAREG